MLYQYNAKDFNKPIVFVNPSGMYYTKSYDVREEYNTEFNLMTEVHEYENGFFVILIIGNPSDIVKGRYKSIISNVELEKSEGMDNLVEFKFPKCK